MKNGMLFIISLMFMAQTVLSDIPFKDVTDIYSTVFYGDYFYETPFNSKNIKNWFSFINSFSLFIQKSEISNKKYILRSLYSLQINNHNLITIIKVIYHQKRYTEKLIKDYGKISSIFKKIQNDLARLQKSLNQIVTTHTIEKEIIVIINEILCLLEVTTYKAEARFNKLI